MSKIVELSISPNSLANLKRGVRFKKGQTPWNAGKIWPEMRGEKHPRWKGFIVRQCEVCDEKFSVPLWRAKDKTRGRYCSLVCRSIHRRAEKAGNWQGGLTSANLIIRHSLEYRVWREAVFKRDDYTCVACGKESHGNIQADHIKPFAYFPELRFAIDNGQTLCVSCHKKTDTYMSGALKYKPL